MMRTPDLPPSGVDVALAEQAARALFVSNEPPAPEAIFAAVRPICETTDQADRVWDLVLVRLAELQAEADGFPVPSINVRAA